VAALDPVAEPAELELELESGPDWSTWSNTGFVIEIITRPGSGLEYVPSPLSVCG
jgi:hypothetical protein